LPRRIANRKKSVQIAINPAPKKIQRTIVAFLVLSAPAMLAKQVLFCLRGCVCLPQELPVKKVAEHIFVQIVFLVTSNKPIRVRLGKILQWLAVFGHDNKGDTRVGITKSEVGGQTRHNL